MTAAKKWLPPLVPAVALLVHAALMYKAALKHTRGVVSYPVDDAFIHLALAKNIALHGNYGVDAHTFASVSSSIGWPLLLALGMKVAGPSAWLPLVFNAAFGLALPFVVDSAVRRVYAAAGVAARLVIGLAVVELTPLPTLVVLGMEHTAHTAFHVAFLAAACTWLASDASDEPKSRRVLGIATLAALTALFRFEAAFPIAIVCGLALLRKRPKSAVAIGAGGAIFPVAYGLFAKMHGSLFLPVPVVLKGRHLDWQKLGDALGVDLMDRFGNEASVLVVALACAGLAVLLIRRDGFWTPLSIALTTCTGVFLLHLELASLGWFYRYESYLLAAGLTFAGAAIASLVPRDFWKLARAEPARVGLSVLSLAMLAMPLRVRAVHANDDTPSACGNIFEQQMQSARFLAKLGEPAAVNDIGAVVWTGDEPIVDLVGLASLPVARAKGLELDRTLSREDMDRFAREAHVKAAIVYDDWFKDGVPGSWLRVGKWRITNNHSCAFPVVSVYATDPASYPEIVDAVRRFAPELPDDILQTGRYLEHRVDDGRFHPGDHVVVFESLPAFSGSFEVDEEGSIGIPALGGLTVSGKNELQVRDLLAGMVARAGEPAPGERSARGSRVEKVVRDPSRLRVVQVAGRVPRSIETTAPTIDAALAAATAPPDAPAWVWREAGETGFTRVERSELFEGKLEPGDIVVVP